MSFFSRLRRAIVGTVTKTVRSAREPLHTSEGSAELPEEQPGLAIEETILTIKSSTVVRVALIVLLVVVGFRLVGELRDVLLLVLFSVIITAALQPFVDKMERRGWPRAVTAALIFAIAIGIIVLMLVILVPMLAEQILDLARNVTNIVQKLFTEGPQTLPLIGPYVARFTGNVDAATIARELEAPLQELGKTLLGKTTDAVGVAGSFAVGLFDSMAVVIISFYMLVRRSNLDGFIRIVTPKAYEEYALQKYRLVLERMGAWLRAQFLVMLFVFILSFIGFSVIGLKYALFLAILAGVFSIVPVVGWISAGILAILLALTQSTWVVVGAIVIVMIVHVADSYIFVPLVTERAVGLSPVAVIIALLIGYNLAGLLGVLVAVPVATAFATFLHARPNVRQQ